MENFEEIVDSDAFAGLDAIARHHHAAMVAKGFTGEGVPVSTQLMMITEEVAECHTLYRKGVAPDKSKSEALEQSFYDLLDDPSEFASQYEVLGKDTIEEELADIVLRVFDFAEREGISIERSIRHKMLYNKSRPHKHGKKF